MQDLGEPGAHTQPLNADPPVLHVHSKRPLVLRGKSKVCWVTAVNGSEAGTNSRVFCKPSKHLGCQERQ